MQDVAAAGGWKSHVVVRDIYTQADAETILDVVLFAGELREARGGANLPVKLTRRVGQRWTASVRTRAVLGRGTSGRLAQLG